METCVSQEAHRNWAEHLLAPLLSLRWKSGREQGHVIQ